MKKTCTQSANFIVTFNLKDFPPSALAPYEISAVHPHIFLYDQFDLNPPTVKQIAEDTAPPYGEPFDAHSEYLEDLRKVGLPNFAKILEPNGL